MEHKLSIAKEHVRSFNAIGCGDSRISLLGFKVLRVLVIEECGFFQGQTLEHLRKLVQLRYLGLVKTSVKLPEGKLSSRYTYSTTTSRYTYRTTTGSQLGSLTHSGRSYTVWTDMMGRK
jgi:hypothetical protein